MSNPPKIPKPPVGGLGPESLRYQCVDPPLGCGKVQIGYFKDTTSWAEYQITQLCQTCQDEIFCSGPGCTKECCNDDSEEET